ncbi:MAG: folate family ECF transporter S component [Atopostipes suicloacalis]|nr:folate family ECF transporter S component [Atopostipes suicloacalis]
MENIEKKKFTFTTKQIAVLGVLMGLRIALSRLSIMVGPNNRLAFGFIIASIIGMLFGPWVAGFSSAGTDLLTSFLFGTQGGPFFIGFTFTAFVGGAVYGFFLHRKEVKWYHVLLAVLVNSVLTNLVLNTLWVHILFETPITVLLATRIPQNLIMGPIRFIIIYLAVTNKQLQNIFKEYSTANK